MALDVVVSKAFHKASGVLLRASALTGSLALATGLGLAGWVPPTAGTCNVPSCGSLPSPRTCGDPVSTCTKYVCSTPQDCESSKQWEYRHTHYKYFCTWEGGSSYCYGAYYTSTKTNNCCNLTC